MSGTIWRQRATTSRFQMLLKGAPLHEDLDFVVLWLEEKPAPTNNRICHRKNLSDAVTFKAKNISASCIAKPNHKNRRKR